MREKGVDLLHSICYRHLIWKVLLQLLGNPVGASGQALCVKGAAEIRPRTWQVEAASLFSESALSSVPA